MVLTADLLEEIRDDVKSELNTLMTHAGVGDDDTTPTAADTSLGNETFRDARDDWDSSGANTIVGSLTIEASENNSNDIDEIGWFDAASGGNLWVHNLVNTISKTSDVIVYIDTTITISVSEG